MPRKSRFMLLPIYAYGHPVLKKVGQDITKDYPKLDELISNMWDTMYNAHGVGLAAPQIGLDIRLFIVDTLQIDDEEKSKDGIKKVFINAHKVEESGKEWDYEEGCLSVPFVRGDVSRPPTIVIEYFDENFKKHKQKFTGINARVIQHEYDHTDGVMFIDKLKPLKKQLVKKKLENIKKGNIDPDYKMKFYTP